MIQLTAEQWILTKNLKSGVVTRQVQKALLSIEERRSVENLDSMIQCLGEKKELSDSNRRTAVNAGMKPLKTIKAAVRNGTRTAWL